MILEHRRRGFTLVELLVVIAIIGILIALLLPAVQSAREAARRAQCSNNMLQLSLALQQHEAAYAHLPAGSDDPGGPIQNVAVGRHIGWIAEILPFLEQQNAFRALDFSKGAYDPKNKNVRDLKLNVLTCPSAGDPGMSFGTSSYAGCHHDVEAPIAVDNHGVLFQNSKVRFEQITDGRSHTIFIGEKLFDPDPNGPSAGSWLPYSPPSPAPADDGALPDGSLPTDPAAPPDPNAPPPDGAAPGEAAQDPAVAAGGAAGFTLVELGWLSGTRATLRNTGTPINASGGGMSGGRQFSPPPAGANSPLWVGGFESTHPGGTNFAFGDGSVRYLSQRINMTVYQQLGHRTDGKLLSDGGY